MSIPRRSKGNGQLTISPSLSGLPGAGEMGRGQGGKGETNGIRDNNIQPPQLLNTLLHNPHTILFHPHIPTQRKRLDAMFSRNGLCDLCRGLGAGDVVDDYVAAFFGEFVADEGAETAGGVLATGDKRFMA